MGKSLHEHGSGSKLRLYSVSKQPICHHLKLAIIFVLYLFQLHHKHPVMLRLGSMGRFHRMGRKWMGWIGTKWVVYYHWKQWANWVDHKNGHHHLD
jgi:hypothetical protein